MTVAHFSLLRRELHPNMDNDGVDWDCLSKIHDGGSIVEVASGALVSDLFKLLTPKVAQTDLTVIKLAMDDHEEPGAVSDLSVIIPKLTVVDMIQHLLVHVFQSCPERAPDIFADVNATKIDTFVDCLLGLTIEGSPADLDMKAQKEAVIELACNVVEESQGNFNVTDETMGKVQKVRIQNETSARGPAGAAQLEHA